MRFLHHKSHREKEKKSSKGLFSFRKSSRKERLAVVQEKEKEKPGVSGVVFLWGLLFMTVVYVAFFSPYLSVVQVSVIGSEAPIRDKVSGFLEGRISGKYFGLLPRNNFFVIRTDALEASLHDEYPLLREADVEKVFPDRMTVEVVRRNEVLLWCSSGPCYLLDENGRASDSSRMLMDGEAIAVRTVTDMSAKPVGFGQDVIDSHFVSFVLALPEVFKESIGMEIMTEFSTPSRFAEELRVRTAEGWEVYFSTSIPMESSLKALKLLLDKEISSDEKRKSLSYVDLRAENRIYYVMKGEEKKEENSDEKKEESLKKEEKKKKK